MEWIETTGRTVHEARETALDQLGVDEREAEFEIVEEPKAGLFGRTKGTARVRARIIPKAPRSKNERKRRTKKTNGSSLDGGGSEDLHSAGDASIETRETRTPKTKPANSRQGSDRPKAAQRKEPMDEAEQVAAVERFLSGLVSAMGLEAEVSSTFDDGFLRANIEGQGLGYLVGPRLATLDAIQEIARTSLQREAAGREYARVTVDVNGIRQQRARSLEAFVNKSAERVAQEQVTVVFEVMSSADRKIVHDVASRLDGVSTSSEGEEPRRRVALRPSTD